MKAIKRTVAALLATLMLATSTSFTLAAEEYSKSEAVVVAKVNAAGIMTGTDKGFEPSKSLTRAEAAAIIVRMKGISESAVKAMAGTTLFKDVAASHWASGYVNEASNLAIVKGVSATEFAPDREVTVAEFVTMAIRALGAGQLVDSEGVWPTNYVNFANDNDILKDVTAIYTATASRLNAATIVANTLEAPIWEKTGVKSNGEISWTKSAEYINVDKTITPAKTILNSVLNIAQYDEVLVAVDKIDRELTATSLDYDDSDPDDIIGTLYLEDADVADSVDCGSVKTGISYDVWYDKDAKEVVGIWEAENSKQKLTTFTEIVDELAGTAGKKTMKFKVNGEDKKYDVVDAPTVYYNGKAETSSETSSNKHTLKENTFGTFKTVNGKVTAIYEEEYTHVGLVDEVTSSKIKFDEIINGMADARTLTIDDEDIVYNMDMTTIKEGDVVFYYQEGADEVYHVLVSTNTVEGKVTAQGEDYIKVDGKKYKTLVSIDNGKDIIGYLNEAGKIVAYQESEDSDSEFAVVKTLEAVNGRKGADIEVVLAYADGKVSETLVVDLEESAKKLSKTDVTNGASKEEQVRAYLTGATVNTASGSYTDLTVDELNDANEATSSTTVLGTIINYTLKGGKLVIKPFEANDYDKDTAKLTVSRKSGIDDYYFNNNTRFVIVKADSDKKYNKKVEVVDLDNLETSTGVTYAVAGISSDKYVDFVVLYNDNKAVKKVTEEGLYGVILNKEELENDADFAFGYTVLFTNGEERTLYSDDNFSAYGASKVDLIGTTAIDFTISGDEITDVDYATGNTSTPTEGFSAVGKATNAWYCVNTDNKGVFEYANVNSGTTLESDIYTNTKRLTLSENVVFIKRSGDADSYKYKTGKESDIIELSVNKNVSAAYTIDDEKEIYDIFTRIDKDGVEEVIAVVYAK